MAIVDSIQIETGNLDSDVFMQNDFGSRPILSILRKRFDHWSR